MEGHDVQDKQVSKTERELQRRFESLQDKSHYEIFDVWEGCGREVVQERYYTLVKQNHPDRYGGNVSDKVKKLSQEIFLLIQNAFRALIKLEDEQRVPPPETQRAQAMSRLSRRTRQDTSETRTSASSMPEPPAREDATQEASSVEIDRFNEPEAKDDLGTSSASEIFEAVTVSTRDASTLKEDSMPEEERRSKLARLARQAKKRPVMHTPISERRTTAQTSDIDEESSPSLSPAERRAKLARLASKSKSSSSTPSSKAPPSGIRRPSRARMQTPISSSQRSSASMDGPHSTASLPDREHTTTNPSKSGDQTFQKPKEFFNEAYTRFRNKRYESAFPLFKEAFERSDPDDNDYGLYMTFYGYTLFLVTPEKKERSQELLEKAIETKHKQALPDAHLFLGYILKTYDSSRKSKEAYAHFKEAHRLNPASHEAAREIRLFRKRYEKKEKEAEENKSGGSFLSRLFGKKD